MITEKQVHSETVMLMYLDYTDKKSLTYLARQGERENDEKYNLENNQQYRSCNDDDFYLFHGQSKHCYSHRWNDCLWRMVDSVLYSE